MGMRNELAMLRFDLRQFEMDKGVSENEARRLDRLIRAIEQRIEYLERTIT